MEELLEIIKYSTSEGFWHFIGCWILIAITLTAVIGLPFRMLASTLRHWSIRKHGWPPAHCDSDGKFKPKDEDE